MSDTKEENVFRSDSEMLQKYNEKINTMDKHIMNISKADFPYAILQVLSLVLTMGALMSGGVFGFMMVKDPSVPTAIKGGIISIGVVLLCVLSWHMLGRIVARFEKDKEAIESLEESMNEDVRQKVAQDLKNLYGAQLSETKPQPDVLSGKPNNEIVLENGDIVSAFLSYDNDGVLTARVQSKIENLDVKDDYAKELKKKHDVIEGLNDLK